MIYIGADHRGLKQKELVKTWLEGRAQEFHDFGAYEYNPEDDYNEAAVAVAKKVVGEEGARGILVCGSGHGECMAANRFRGVRAINGLTPEMVKVGREHNDANVLCLAADFVPDPEGVLKAFFGTEFLGEERYERRNRKLDEEV